MKSYTYRSLRAGAIALAASLMVATAPLAIAQDDETPSELPEQLEESTSREHAPVTDHCPNALAPPEPTTTSEQLAPGQETPSALPVPAAAAERDCGVTATEGFTVPEEVVASAWLVADIDSGEIIAQKDPHGRYRPASIIKALLALVAIRDLDLQQEVTVSHESAAQEGSAVGLGEDGVYTVEQLLQGLLLASGNDAAHALAQELGGDEATLAKINELAVELGTTDTRAATYSGLDAPGMSSSAFDLGLIYLAAYQDPVFSRIANTEFVDFPGYDGHEGYQVWNDNGLFMNDPDGIGGKTGYTDDANHTFVGAMDRDGRRLMAIVLDTTIDGGRPWVQAQQLLHEAYDQPTSAGVGTLEPVDVETTVTPSPTATMSPEEIAAGSSEPTSGISPALGIGIGVGVVVLLILAIVGVLGARKR